ncbi:MAG TPA: hypothetical protein PLJ84_02350 [Bacteroidales bacterium]|nr:hypothetical protein [Bacteroidales bacterium]
MNTTIGEYNRILFLDLRPWLLTDVPEAKFKQDLNGLQKVFCNIQPLYEVNYPKALTAKRKYFRMLIDNAANRFLNEFHNEISLSIDQHAKKYLIHMALTRTLNDKLQDVARVMEEHGYALEQHGFQESNSPEGAVNEDGNYITSYLKQVLVRLYLEVQDSYPELVSADILDEKDIYRLYFRQGAPDPSGIIKIDKIKIATPGSPLATRVQQAEFRAIAADFRKEAKGVLPYGTIIHTPSRFATFEEQLYLHGYIDTDYNFTNRHGMKNEMAAIYHLLIKKGYFSPRNFEGKKAIRPVDIRRFLDYRYNINIDRQFRNYKNNPEEVAAFAETHIWFGNLPTG